MKRLTTLAGQPVRNSEDVLSSLIWLEMQACFKNSRKEYFEICYYVIRQVFIGNDLHSWARHVADSFLHKHKVTVSTLNPLIRKHWVLKIIGRCSDDIIKKLVKVQIQQFGCFWEDSKREKGNDSFKNNQAQQTWVDMRLNGQGRNQKNNGYCVHVAESTTIEIVETMIQAACDLAKKKVSNRNELNPWFWSSSKVCFYVFTIHVYFNYYLIFIIHD